MHHLVIPPFRPHPLLRNGHAQTLAGVIWPGKLPRYTAVRCAVSLPDGDRLVLHDDCPRGWRIGDRVALLVHGLSGCHRSPYMQRIAAKLCRRGVRTFRLDLRGCGAGEGLARWPYHAGRSEDARAAMLHVADLCKASPLTLVGFSLGGNIILKLLGELADQRLPGLEQALAVCPPADLRACAERLRRWDNRLYDWHFVSTLVGQVRRRRKLLPDAALVRWKRTPRGLREFDNSFTAPLGGFADVDDYYAQASSLPLLDKIRIPTLILAAEDDPVVPSLQFDRTRQFPAVRVHLEAQGGHLGFIAKSGNDPDNRWLDWRVVDWCARRHSLVGLADPLHAVG